MINIAKPASPAVLRQQPSRRESIEFCTHKLGRVLRRILLRHADHWQCTVEVVVDAGPVEDDLIGDLVHSLGISIDLHCGVGGCDDSEQPGATTWGFGVLPCDVVEEIIEKLADVLTLSPKSAGLPGAVADCSAEMGSLGRSHFRRPPLSSPASLRPQLRRQSLWE